jgi:hypothetical protein
LERLAAEREQVHEVVNAVIESAAAGDRDATESRELLQSRSRLGELEQLITEQADVAEQVAGARDVSALIRRDQAPVRAITTDAPPAPGRLSVVRRVRARRAHARYLIARHAATAPAQPRNSASCAWSQTRFGRRAGHRAAQHIARFLTSYSACGRGRNGRPCRCRAR